MEQEHSALSDLVADLRSRTSLSLVAIAAATHRSRWTLGRYESGALRPPVGYIALLAQEVLRQDEARGNVEPRVVQKLLETVNGAIIAYYGHSRTLASWESLGMLAEGWVAAGQSKDSQPVTSTALPSPLEAGAERRPALWQLRAATADFIGRAGERARLVAALRGQGDDLRKVGLACVRGLGGAGKTELVYRVAEDLAEDFPDGQLLIGLAGSSPGPLRAEEALAQLVRAIAPQERLPEGLAELRAQYRTALRDRRVLIVADDARDAAQLRDLLPPLGSALLITTRWRFALDGLVEASIVELGGLAPDEAAQLLLALAPRAGDATVELAAICGYLPLALRIIGGRLASDGTLRVAHYLAQLRDACSRLAAFEDDVPERSVVAALRLSYAALDPLSQTAFAQLSVFPADFARDALAGVVLLPDAQEQRDGHIDQVLSRLYKAGLVEIDPQGERIKLHDLVRAFAAAQLADLGPARRHAATYGNLVRRLNELARNQGEALLQVLAVFDGERPHIDAGIQWVLHHAEEPEAETILVDYMVGLAAIGRLRFHFREVLLPLYSTGLELARRRFDPSLEVVALNALGVLTSWLGDEEGAQRLYEQALAVLSTYPEAGQAVVRHNLAVSVARQGYDAVAPEAEEGNLEGLLLRGMIARQRGQEGVAVKHAETALTLARQRGDLKSERVALCNLANAVIGLWPGTATREMLYEKAYGYADQALALAEQLHDANGQAHALAILGNAANILGDPQVAIVRYGEALALFQASGQRHFSAVVLLSLGDAHRALHEIDLAAAYYEQAISELEAVGDHYGLAQACWRYGALILRLHEYRHDGPDIEEARRAVQLWERTVTYEQAVRAPDAQRHADDLAQLRAWLIWNDDREVGDPG